MRVGDLMRTDVLAVGPEDRLADAALRMATQGVGALAVLEGEALIGIVSERDLVRAMADGHPPRVAAVSAHMTPDPICAVPEMTLEAALRLLVEADVRHLPVVEGDRLVGMLSARDVLEQVAWGQVVVRPSPPDAP